MPFVCSLLDQLDGAAEHVSQHLTPEGRPDWDEQLSYS